MSPCRFNPTGSLDIASDPADLPSQTDGKVEVSGAMTRCINLHLDRAGIASTRRGSGKLNTTAINTSPTRIIEQAGVRYTFAGTGIYRDEVEIITGLTADPWSALLYNSYLTTTQAVFATNGTDRKRIEGSSVYEWGSESPTEAPVLAAGSLTGLTGDYNAKYTWCRKEGATVVWESNPSPPADTAVTLANQSLLITVTQPTDPQITHVRIYRTLTGGAIYYWDQDIPAGVDTTAYDYSYMQDWEVDYVPGAGDQNSYDFAHTFAWEFDYLPNIGYLLFNQQNGGYAETYTWENDHSVTTNDDGYKYSYYVSTIVVDPADYDGFQCLFADIDNDRVIAYSWELDYTDSSLSEDSFKTTTQVWEYNLYFFYETNIADDSLGPAVNWIDHDRLPLGATMVLGPVFNGLCFALVGNLLYYSLPNQPEYWPELYYIEVGNKQFPLTGAAFINGTLYVSNAIEIYAIQGSGPGTFFPLPLSAQAGAVNADCFIAIQGFGGFHLGHDGIYQYTSGKDSLITRGQFEPLFRGETVGTVPGLNRTYIANCWLASYHSKLYFGYPGGTSEYPDNILIYDLSTNRAVLHQYAAAFQTVGIDYTNSRLLAGDTNGYIWQWEVLTLTDDDGTDIPWEVQSKDFNQYYKYFPRYAKYDVRVTDGTAAGYIIVDEVSKQTHTITGDRNTRKRLVAGCTGDRLAVRLSGSGRVQVFGVEVE